ncbi:MAG TPA: putative toxin-antitoxin system toxin component, PIN family [Tepidisphaeraceae bacterium]
MLDTNVLVAGFGTSGMCQQVIEACLQFHELFTSQVILSELERNLLAKFELSDVTVVQILQHVRQHAVMVEPAPVPAEACHDQSDLPILGTAVAAGADCLVTGDHDLLTLQRFERTTILSPRQFHDLANPQR